jgi:hypothetical protein
MSHTAHHGSHRDAGSPGARGSGVWAGRDPQAATGGQAATSTHTPDRHRAAYPPGSGQTRISPPDLRPAWAPGALLACPTSSPSPADVATRGRPDDALAWHRAPTPLTAAPSGGCATTRSAGTAAVAGTSRAQTGHGAGNSVPGPRRAGPQGHGGVSVAVPEPSLPDPRSHHHGLPGQRFIARNRCR